MPWVRFIANMDWKPTSSSTIGYLTGHVVNVTKACAARALADGKAVKMVKRSRNGAPEEVGHDQ